MRKQMSDGKSDEWHEGMKEKVTIEYTLMAGRTLSRPETLQSYRNEFRYSAFLVFDSLFSLFEIFLTIWARNKQ